MTYHDVLNKVLDINDVTVGGGSSAALSGAMAAGLIGMVSLLSVGKECGLSDDRYRKIAEQCGTLRDSLLQGCVDDAAAYRQIVDAYKLPKGTDEEKAVRRAAIQAAGIAAAATPRDNGRHCKTVHVLGCELWEKSNQNASSDLMYGIGLSKLGVEGCIANIEANLPLIKDEAVKAQFDADMKELRE